MPDKSNPAQIAAKASVVAPLLAFLLSYLLNAGMEGNKAADADMRHTVSVVTVVAAGVLLATGLVAAIAALTKIRTAGRRGVMGYAVAGIVLNLVLIGSILAGMELGRRNKASRDAHDKLIVATDRLLDAAQKQVKQGPTSAPAINPAMMNDAADALTQGAQAGDPRQRGGLMVVAELARTMGQELKEYQGITQRFKAAGGLSPAGLTSPDLIDQRLAVVDQWEKVNDRLDQTLKTGPARVKAALLAGGVPEAESQSLMASFIRGYQPELNGQIREDERKLIAAGRQILRLLKSSWGHWHFDADQRRITFEDPADLTSFNRANQELQDTAAHQHTLQTQLVQQNVADREQAGGRQQGGR